MDDDTIIDHDTTADTFILLESTTAINQGNQADYGAMGSTQVP